MPYSIVARVEQMKRENTALKSETVKRYLPDESELTPKRTSREFISAIINTLDPTFFEEAINRAETLRKEKKGDSSSQMIEIDESMLAILK